MSSKNQRSFRLPNGLEVITYRYPHVQSVHVNLLVKVGSRYETTANNGISHFLEHLMTDRIDEQTHQAGPKGGYVVDECTGHTYKDRTEYERTTHATELEPSLRGMVGALRSAGFRKDEIEAQQGIITAEILESENNSDSKYERIINGALYGDHPLGLPTLGSKSTVLKLTARQISAWHRRYYAPGNAQLTITGSFDVAKVRRWLRSFAKDQPARPARHPHPKPAKPKSVQAAPAKPIFRKTPGTQTYLGYFQRIPTMELPRFVAWEFLIDLLDNYLFYTLRDRGLCYTLDVRSITYSDMAEVSIETFIKPKTVAAFRRRLEKKLREFMPELRTQDLAALKHNRITRLKIKQDDIRAQSESLGWSNAVYGKPVSLEQQQVIIAKVSIEELDALFSETFLSRKAAILVAGPNSGK